MLYATLIQTEMRFIRGYDIILCVFICATSHIPSVASTLSIGGA